VSLLAHCGANWAYCDGGSIVGGVALLWVIRRSVKRAERQARERAADRATARAVADIVAKRNEQERQDAP
jgi:hypothetical protein